VARILGIDYGTKRVGLATTDPLQIITSPLETVATQNIFDYLTNYIETEDVEAIVVGMPLKSDGSPTDSTPHVIGFVRKLKKLYPHLLIAEEDEAFTSKMAVEAMILGGMKKKDRQKKENLDKLSATFILNAYLENL
jgi:putative Holliday junction resolvase